MLVDGSPRVACVTAVRRVAGRSVVTAAGLEPEVRRRLVDAFARHGASQCGFCTPGILCRLASLGPSPDPAKVETALLAHLCRCTGWRTILDAACDQGAGAGAGAGEGEGEGEETLGGKSVFGLQNASNTAQSVAQTAESRPQHPEPPEPTPAERRATLEGGAPQIAGPGVILGAGGFADDLAPPGCLIAVPDGAGGWAVGETLEEARAASGKVQGRRSGQALSYPVDVPPGDWDLTLQTTWVEPAYLEPDSSWCEPGGDPASPVANGGAFGGKLDSIAPVAARQLADLHGRPVRVVLSREDVVRLGPKRPPIGAGVRADGTGVLRLAGARTESLNAALATLAPGLDIQYAPVDGPPVSRRIRAAGWAEAAVLLAGAEALREGRVPTAGSSPDRAGEGAAEVESPAGARARAEVRVDAGGWPLALGVTISCGPPLDAVTLRSYVTGASHMALGWVCSEAIAVGEDGVPTDLTIRSFGILRAKDTPPMNIEIVDGTSRGQPPVSQPVNGSDAVFAAVAAATWIAQGLPSRWPTRRGRTP